MNDSTGSGYRSRFDHSEEIATAGYYSVNLQDYHIRAELTATPRVAFQRYTFPASEESRILFDIGNRQGESGAVKDASVTLNDDGTVEGWVITLPEYVKKYQPGAQVPLYFSLYWINSHHCLVRSRERNNSREQENSKGLVPVFT